MGSGESLTDRQKRDRNVHRYIRCRYTLTGRCEYCGKTDRPTEWATATYGVYTKNRADWFEFCRRCHRYFDGHGARVRKALKNPQADQEVLAQRWNRNVHVYMRRHYPLTGRCEYCGATDRPTEYATAARGVYTRNRADWFEFCRWCHRRFDGHAARVSAANSGRGHNAETRVLISAHLRGKKGVSRPHSEKDRKAISDGVQKAMAEGRWKSNFPKYETRSDADKQAISEGLKRAYREGLRPSRRGIPRTYKEEK